MEQAGAERPVGAGWLGGSDQCWVAPAKINLDLRVHPPTPAGRHPIYSHVQTISHHDILRFSPAEEDALVVDGPDIGPENDNLVTLAVQAVRETTSVPPVRIELTKRIPHQAGLGGGSSDAAAVIRALTPKPGEGVSLASRIGSDVPFFLTGGLARLEGHGEQVTSLATVTDYAVAVANPEFGLSTRDVYRRWDELEGQEGAPVEAKHLPPRLRHLAPLVNDLLPAALDLHQDFGDWISDLADLWDRPVLMSGSGSACFSFFTDEEEAESACAALSDRRGFSAVPTDAGVTACEED